MKTGQVRRGSALWGMGSMPTNVLTQRVDGRWWLLGRVSPSLRYARKDGQPLTASDEVEITRIEDCAWGDVTDKRTGYKRLIWDTKAAALSAKG